MNGNIINNMIKLIKQELLTEILEIILHMVIF